MPRTVDVVVAWSLGLAWSRVRRLGATGRCNRTTVLHFFLELLCFLLDDAKASFNRVVSGTITVVVGNAFIVQLQSC